MVENKKTKRQRDIKAKLMAAIAMLLVSSIMMVSTTYAWFTLSTAPEVTGITTAVGANGNLEMALQPLDGNSAGIKSAAGDSMDVQFAYLANTTWGNLVDVSDTASYGMDKIMLYPAKLNTTTNTDGKTAVADNPLATPEYGSDGRVANLATKSITGIFDGEKFIENEDAFGVRAIGTSSSMSDRQLAYRAALAAANTAAGQAKRAASQSLDTNGANLANIAIKHATVSAGETDTYTVAELQPLKDIVDSILAEGGPLDLIETAMVQYALAAALGNTSGITDDNYARAKTDFEGATLATLDTVMKNWGVNTAHPELYALITADIATLNATRTKVSTAQSDLQTLLAQNKESYVWDDFSSTLTNLANPNKMKINGIAVENLKGNWYAEPGDDIPDGYYIADGSEEKPGEVGYVYDTNKKIVSNMARLVEAVMKGGIQLIIGSGAGIYADVADFCGDYSASIKLASISYGGMTVNNLDATMKTQTSQNPTYLAGISEKVPNFAAGQGGSSSNAISDYYGYILDLAFRTNVAGSNLQLQQTAVDRIYAGNTANEQTMGHGASMTFQSSEATFSGNQVKSLMGCIRIIFFNSDTKAIIGYAKLDPTSAVEDNGKITMTIVMTDANGTVLEDNKTIMALEQNTVHELSVMVYLDGEKVENKDVANGASSMTGTMNLQFSSSATLTPMEYTDLRTGTNGGAERIFLKEVSGQGVTIGAAAYDGTNVVIQLRGINAGETVTVKIGENGAEQTVEVQSYNSFTGIQVTASDVTADTPIVVTYTAPAQGGENP